MRFDTGRVVLHRHWTGDRLALVKTCVVAGDDERGLLLWVPRGAPMLDRRTVDGRPQRAMPFAEWITAETELKRVGWEGYGVLMLLPPGEAHSVWWLRDDAGALRAIYVNLEEPAARWDDGPTAGVDIVDQDLDIWVTPDGRWEWKDVAELTERLAYPEHYWVPDPAAVWAEGERLVKRIEAREFPFDGSYLDFRPDPAWRVPAEVPAGWDRPRA